MDDHLVASDPDGRPRRIGGAAEFDWIHDNLRLGATINSAIPEIYEAYATVVIERHRRTVGREHGTLEDLPDDAALMAILTDHVDGQPWWLGFLETGGADTIIPTAPMVTPWGWGYVLIEAGPTEAATWRGNHWSHGRTLPDLIFPADRSWLVNTLWDDDWRCVGGPQSLIDAIVANAALDSRRVSPGQDMTPPGHTMR